MSSVDDKEQQEKNVHYKFVQKVSDSTRNLIANDSSRSFLPISSSRSPRKNHFAAARSPIASPMKLPGPLLFKDNNQNNRVKLNRKEARRPDLPSVFYSPPTSPIPRKISISNNNHVNSDDIYNSPSDITLTTNISMSELDLVPNWEDVEEDTKKFFTQEFSTQSVCDWIKKRVPLDEEFLDAFCTTLAIQWRRLDKEEVGVVTVNELRSYLWYSYTLKEHNPDKPFPQNLQRVFNHIMSFAEDKDYLTFWEFADSKLSAEGVDITVYIPTQELLAESSD